MAWLQTLAGKYTLDLNAISNASSDASFRHYYRIPAATATVIAMDAPPEREDNPMFIHVTGLLQEAGLRVPAILEQDLEHGFLLLEDLGVDTYYATLQNDPDEATVHRLYRDAIATLVAMQQADTRTLPQYDQARLLDELSLFIDWYVVRHCQATLTDKEHATLTRLFDLLTHQNAQSPSVFVHRDFHSPNLIVAPDQTHTQRPGLIDYQDALAGPITYDIASLVMDARFTWDEAQQLDWAIRYWDAARAAGLPVPRDFTEFHHAYEWMSLQRNLRILGVFARLSHRDGKHHYLAHLPRVNAYIRQVASRYAVFNPLLHILERIHDTPVQTGYTF